MSDPILEKMQPESKVYQSIQDMGEDWTGSISVEIAMRLRKTS